MKVPAKVIVSTEKVGLSDPNTGAPELVGAATGGAAGGSGTKSGTGGGGVVVSTAVGTVGIVASADKGETVGAGGVGPAEELGLKQSHASMTSSCTLAHASPGVIKRCRPASCKSVHAAEPVNKSTERLVFTSKVGSPPQTRQGSPAEWVVVLELKLMADPVEPRYGSQV